MIPGLKTIITPIWAGLGRGFILMITWSWGWIVFVVKGVYSAHMEVIRHFILSEDEVDIKRRMNKK